MINDIKELYIGREIWYLYKEEFGVWLPTSNTYKVKSLIIEGIRLNRHSANILSFYDRNGTEIRSVYIEDAFLTEKEAEIGKIDKLTKVVNELEEQLQTLKEEIKKLAND